MHIHVNSEAVQRKLADLEHIIRRRRAERTEWLCMSMPAYLADMRLWETCYIQVRSAMQREFDRYKDQEAHYQAEADWFIHGAMNDYKDDQGFLELVENLSSAVAQRATGDRAARAFEKPKSKLRSLLAYTQLRRELYVILVQDGLRQIQIEDAIAEEQQIAFCLFLSSRAP
ncbi:hypothetical protein OPT61_g5168 [Boeremia exigua]|uniref:Uncharacterized protein n=1 Tax=Boeremia exigua TaxID=749465 RepID=A0ACC2IBF4_9PLEO|nr:hypothetical protein OPT61_g5168 [Boeremia exigua]